MIDRDGRRRPETIAPPAVGAVGLVTIVVGTFLPWLRSGTHERNSYQTGGAVRRLAGTSGVVDHLLALWPLVGVLCAAAAGLFLIGLRGFSALVGAVTAIGSGAAATAALATTATSIAKVRIIGPVITLTGATLVALAVLLGALVAAASPRRTP